MSGSDNVKFDTFDNMHSLAETKKIVYLEDQFSLQVKFDKKGQEIEFNSIDDNDNDELDDSNTKHCQDDEKKTNWHQTLKSQVVTR